MKHNPGVTEQHIQAILMPYVMEKLRHELVIPNARDILDYECDMVSFSRNGLLHEWEIKLDRWDFADDKNKPKHKTIPTAKTKSPAYFWYVTYNFPITPPAHAGWVIVTAKGEVKVMKEAPRHNEWKMEPDKYRYAAITLSKRVVRMYQAYYFQQKP